MHDVQENPWKSFHVPDIPRQIVLEGVNGNGIRAYFILRDEPAKISKFRKWFKTVEHIEQKGGTFFYLAIPTSTGYMYLNSRSDWEPTHWRLFDRNLPAELKYEPAA